MMEDWLELKKKATILGLTGGIGSGKSTISSYLKKKGIELIDADEISRNIILDSNVIEKLVFEFGKDILDNNGSVNRKKLAAKAFANLENQTKLNDIMHKAIINEMLESVIRNIENGAKILCLDVPLLFERGLEKYCTYTWVVVTDEKIKIDRIIKRDNMTKEEIYARINKQMSDEKKKSLATEVIYNNKGKEELYAQVDELLEKYEII